MITRNNEYYFILPNGIGDSLIMKSLHSTLEEVYAGKINYIIKDSHKFIFGSKWENYCIVGGYTKKELFAIASKSSSPQMGKLFVAHPTFHNDGELDKRFLRHEISFVQMYGLFFGIEVEKIEWENVNRTTDSLLFPKLKEICGTDCLSEIVLFAPEMNSGAKYEIIQPNWADQYYELLKEKYKYVIYNATDSEFGRGIKNRFSIEDIITIGMNCKCVITSRSGLADVLYGASKSMRVIYPNKGFYNLFRLDYIWSNLNPNVEEIILNVKEYFVTNGYKKICIYGYGEGGQRIKYSLQKEGIEVIYAVDKKVDTDEIKIYRPYEKIPDADVMVICVNEDSKCISKSLKYPFVGKIVGMNEIMGSLKMPEIKIES